MMSLGITTVTRPGTSAPSSRQIRSDAISAVITVPPLTAMQSPVCSGGQIIESTRSSVLVCRFSVKDSCGL